MIARADPFATRTLHATAKDAAARPTDVGGTDAADMRTLAKASQVATAKAADMGSAAEATTHVATAEAATMATAATTAAGIGGCR